MADVRCGRHSCNVTLLFATLSAAWAFCPAVPVLKDDDERLVLLSQNLQFIAIGKWRDERATLLDGYLRGDGAAVDLLLLSEARDVDALEDAMGGWCFYGQSGDGRTGYSWTPAAAHRSPGGLVLGVRQREEGSLRLIDGPAGKVFSAKPVTFAEGWLGRMVNFVKGWANVRVDNTSYMWTHTQASYDRHPERGAGGPAVGRAGQFAELASAVPRSEPALLTGDLNVLDGFHSRDAVFDSKLTGARTIDAQTLRSFIDRTGMLFHPEATTCPDGSYVGSVDATRPSESRYFGATFDRVGTNSAFSDRHPDTTVRCEEILGGGLRVSDHRGLLIDVPTD